MKNKTNLAKDYNCALAVVDVAIIDFRNRRLLLGKKSKETEWRFIGGFFDIHKDKSFERAARRELGEEAPNIEPSALRYIGSNIIDDPRYKSDKDKLVTCLFYGEYLFGNTKAGDDLAELDWFYIDKIKLSDIVKEHHVLMDMFLGWWVNFDKTVYES